MKRCHSLQSDPSLSFMNSIHEFDLCASICAGQAAFEKTLSAGQKIGDK